MDESKIDVVVELVATRMITMLLLLVWVVVLTTTPVTNSIVGVMTAAFLGCVIVEASYQHSQHSAAYHTSALVYPPHTHSHRYAPIVVVDVDSDDAVSVVHHSTDSDHHLDYR